MRFDAVPHNVKNKQYVLFPFGKKAICPACSGLLFMTEIQGKYKCYDCKAMFNIVGEGITDRDVFCVQIGG